MLESSYSGNTKKTNLQRLFLKCWRLYDSNFILTRPCQGDLLKGFKESNLAKFSFLKLLTKENLLGCFH